MTIGPVHRSPLRRPHVPRLERHRDLAAGRAAAAEVLRAAADPRRMQGCAVGR